MYIDEVKPGEIVYYDKRTKSGELIYTVAYKIIKVLKTQVMVEILAPDYLAEAIDNKLKITVKDFERFYKNTA